MGYAAILFDLFDTLVRFDRERLPEIVVDGRPVRSTAGHLHAVLRSRGEEVTLAACYRALVDSWQEAERLRAIDHREVSAPARFATFFRRLGLQAGEALTQELIEAHRQQLAKAASVEARHRALLERLARRYRLAVVSNFDYTPTAVGILEREGVAGLFGAIVVSDAIGWRKPRREIFDVALGRVGVASGDALFVGDRADIDVAGAQAVGMAAAWLNPERAALPPGVAPPAYELRDLAELEEVLGA